MAGEKVKCRYEKCSKIFIKTYNRVFCSKVCCNRHFHKIYSKKNDYKLVIKDVAMRLCLGIHCQGQKYFKSHNKFNRVCENCKNSSLYRSSILEKFE